MTQYNPNPIYTPMAGYNNVNANITKGTSAINVKIAELKLAFYNELKAHADQTDNEGVATITYNLNTLLATLNGLNVAMLKLLTSPSTYDSAYTSSILTSLNTTVLANLADTTTGLTAAAKDAMWNRDRARLNAHSSRAVRRINAIESSRLPYAGAASDLIAEHDQDQVWALADLNWKITEKEADMAYDFQRKKISEAQMNEDLNMKDKHENQRRKLDAYTKYDAMQLQNHWNYYEVTIKKILAYVEGALAYVLKIVNGGEQITFENWMEMSKTLMSAHFQMAAIVSEVSGTV